MVGITPLLAISGVVMMKVMASVSEKGQKAYAKAGSVATEVLGAMKTVTAFTGESRELER
jgi:ATP-binding cassette subfamily B (MDR/TAP) protein 1